MPRPVLVEVRHPLVQHKLTLLRDQATSTRDFRALCSELAGMLAYEATRGVDVEPVDVTTPLVTTRGVRVSGKKIGVVPILRAGVAMLDGVLAMIPVARVGFLGVYRDEETLRPVVYYAKLPADLAQREVLLLDPMLATGGSAVAAVRRCKDAGARSIRFVCLLAAPVGVSALHNAHPDVEIYTAAVDRELTDKGYIMPGLGDAGDRAWGTR
jgi:uracil phosphoribosyltransferase